MLDRFPPYLLVAIGGMFGAVSRYWVTGLLKNMGSIPYGTLAVNALGSLVLAFMFTMYSFNYFDSYWIILLGTGFLGSFTTMSTFVVESLNLANDGVKLLLLNISVTLLLVFTCGLLGRLLAISYIQWSGII